MLNVKNKNKKYINNKTSIGKRLVEKLKSQKK